jgi:hypothetical protein
VDKKKTLKNTLVQQQAAKLFSSGGREGAQQETDHSTTVFSC